VKRMYVGAAELRDDKTTGFA